jgi:hypothetical protein
MKLLEYEKIENRIARKIVNYTHVTKYEKLQELLVEFST